MTGRKLRGGDNWKRNVKGKRSPPEISPLRFNRAAFRNFEKPRIPLLTSDFHFRRGRQAASRLREPEKCCRDRRRNFAIPRLTPVSATSAAASGVFSSARGSRPEKCAGRGATPAPWRPRRDRALRGWRQVTLSESKRGELSAINKGRYRSPTPLEKYIANCVTSLRIKYNVLCIIIFYIICIR